MGNENGRREGVGNKGKKGIREITEEKEDEIKGREGRRENDRGKRRKKGNKRGKIKWNRRKGRDEEMREGNEGRTRGRKGIRK